MGRSDGEASFFYRIPNNDFPNNEYTINEYTNNEPWKTSENWMHGSSARKSAFPSGSCIKIPSEEKYKLSNQIVRASRSATACIAEGYGRFHYQENIQYCRQSRGSLYELIDHLLVARECDYIDEAGADELTGKIKRAIQTLNGYIRYLKGKKSEI